MDLRSKLTSRKFWVTLISIGVGIAGLFGADGNIVATVAGALTALIPSVVYVLTEGKIDAAGVKKIAESVSEAADAVAGGMKTDEKE